VDRHVLLLNQAALLFCQERFAHTGQVLESMFHSISEADDWVAMRAHLLLLEVYLHTYKASAPGDSVTRSVISSANRILSALDEPRAFNDRMRCLAAVEAAHASFRGSEASASASSEASASAGAAEHEDEGVELIGPLSRLCTPQQLVKVPTRKLAAVICGTYFFRLHSIKARFALASGDVTTATDELERAVARWRTEVLESGSSEGTDARGIDPDDECPRVLLPVVGRVSSPHVDAGGTSGFPRRLRAELLALRARLLLLLEDTAAAAMLIDAAYALSSKLPDPPHLLGAASSKGGPRMWPVGTQTVSRALHLNNLAMIHAKTGRLHVAAALLSRAVHACAEEEIALANAVIKGGGPSSAVTEAISKGKEASPEDVTALHTVMAGPAGDARLGQGLATARLPPRREILHNAGVVALMRHRPLEAFFHLRRAVMLFRQRPRLWIRLAEACIMYYEQCKAATVAGAVPAVLGDEWQVPASTVTATPAVTIPGATDMPRPGEMRNQDMCWAGAGVIRGVLGEGRSQRLLLQHQPNVCPEPAMPDQLAVKASARVAGADAVVGDSSKLVSSSPVEPEAPSLQYARACLENALCLLPAAPAVMVESPAVHATIAERKAADSPEEATRAAEAKASADASVKAAGAGWRHTRAAALTKLSYVCLCLHDPVAALRYANQVASESRPPDDSGTLQLWFLSRLYAAEAFCRLNRADDATELLLRSSPPSTGQSSYHAEGASALHVNLAIAQTLARNPSRASASVSSVLNSNPLATESRAVCAFISQSQRLPADARELLSRGIAPVTLSPSPGGGSDSAAAATAAAARAE
jgi:hypothetical protein